MSLITYARNLLPGSKSQGFCPRHYWEKRHQRCAGTLQATGNQGLDDEANRTQYGRKWARLRDMITHYFPRPAGQTLLDAGCGHGVLVPGYRNLGFEVVGVDLSRTAIRAAKARGLDAQFHCCLLSGLNLNRRFDVVCVVDVLLHVVSQPDWHESLAGLARHLNPQGVLFILDCLWEQDPNESHHVRHRPRGDYIAAFADLGLRLDRHEQFDLEPEQSTKDLIAVRLAEPHGTPD